MINMAKEKGCELCCKDSEVIKAYDEYIDTLPNIEFESNTIKYGIKNIANPGFEFDRMLNPTVPQQLVLSMKYCPFCGRKLNET